MNILLRFCHRNLMIGVACGLGVVAFAFAGREARAEIVITMSVGGMPPIDLIAFTTPLATDPGQLNNYGTVDLTLLNTALTGLGSPYQFTALGGSSNFAGSPSGGTLSLTGGIDIPAGVAGIPGLTLTETETGFSIPSATAPGLLASSSTGNYNDAGSGNSHSANSSFDAMTTPTYSVSSTSTGPDPQTGAASMGVSFSAPYSLSNFISFSLTPSTTSTPTDSFGVTAKVTAVPEPASAIMMLTGLLPALGFVALCRRHRATATH
jgi:hypothetical protein